MAITRRSPGEFGYVLPLLLVMLALFVAAHRADAGAQRHPAGIDPRALPGPDRDLGLCPSCWGARCAIAVITTIVCALLGYPLAYWMRGLSPAAPGAAVALVVLPSGSDPGAHLCLIVVLGICGGGEPHPARSRAGWGRRVAFHYNELGVIIGTTNVLLTLPRAAAVRRHGQDRRPAAAGRGIARPQPRHGVPPRVLPAQRPGAAAGSILGFILTSASSSPGHPRRRARADGGQCARPVINSSRGGRRRGAVHHAAGGVARLLRRLAWIGARGGGVVSASCSPPPACWCWPSCACRRCYRHPDVLSSAARWNSRRRASRCPGVPSPSSAMRAGCCLAELGGGGMVSSTIALCRQPRRLRAGARHRSAAAR